MNPDLTRRDAIIAATTILIGGCTAELHYESHPSHKPEKEEPQMPEPLIRWPNSEAERIQEIARALEANAETIGRAISKIFNNVNGGGSIEYTTQMVAAILNAAFTHKHEP